MSTHILVFGIVVAFSGCGLKKVIFIKKTLFVEVGLVFIYIWLKLWFKLRLNKK